MLKRSGANASDVVLITQMRNSLKAYNVNGLNLGVSVGVMLLM